MNKRDWMNLPNLLTSIRILLAPALLLAFFRAGEERRLQISLCLFLTAGITDCLDGLAARKLHQITNLGKVLDPIADKLFTASVLLCLTVANVIPWPVLALMVFKELYMGAGAAACLRHHIEVASDIYGKLATALFYPAVLLAWPWHGIEMLCHVGRGMIFLSVALSIVAAIHYTLASVQTWKEQKAQQTVRNT